MKCLIAAFLPLIAVAPAFAVKPCQELKSEIGAKSEANGVKNYQLEIVPAADVRDQQVVGSCDGGTKNIIYKKVLPRQKPPAAK